MKKALVLLLAVMLVALVLPGCSPKEAAAEATHLGLGIVTSIAKSRDMAGETTARAQADVTIAAVTFDKNGKIVHVQIDVAQTRVEFNEDMTVKTDRASIIKTKKELGRDYGMKRVSGIQKEWHEQMAAFEAWMIGKTVEEIKSLKVKVVDDAHQHVPDIEELTSSVTITVESYIAAVDAAWNNKIEVENVEKMGLGITTSIAKSRNYNANVEPAVMPRAQVDSVISAAAFDADGKVVGVLIDNAQIRIDYDAEGKVTSDKAAEYKTKKQLGDAYNMKRVSNIGKEWYEQMAAFEAFIVGKTSSEVVAMPVRYVDDAHQHVPAVDELLSSVTITVESYIKALVHAAANAR